jgi:hypothetical protein
MKTILAEEKGSFNQNVCICIYKVLQLFENMISHLGRITAGKTVGNSFPINANLVLFAINH